jgi:hypothetical protein
MFSVPQEVQAILIAFAPLFSAPVWQNAKVLIIGAILCVGKRTVTAALKVMGLQNEKRFTNYHRVLNRAKWNTLNAAKILLCLIINILPPGFPLIIAADESIERRKGKKIKAKGCYRDAVRSSQRKVIYCFGLKWVCMMAIVPLPWSKRPWALPFLTVLAPSKKYHQSQNKRHKTTVDWACQMIMQVRRWLPKRFIVLVGDGAYAAVKLALCCNGLPTPVCLVSRLRLDAALYDFPPPDTPGKRGPKPKKGNKQTPLHERINDESTEWTSIVIDWYDGIKRELDFFPAYRCGIRQVRTPYLSNGLWFVIRKANYVPRPFLPLILLFPKHKSSLGLCLDGTLKSHLRKCEHTWALKPNGSGQILPSRELHRHFLDCYR